MLAALRRELIRHEYWAQAPATPTNPQITPRPVTVSTRRRLRSRKSRVEETAFNAVLGWLREGVLTQRLEALEADKPVQGAGESALIALRSWTRVSPPLAKVDSLDSYLRLAASLRSQVGPKPDSAVTSRTSSRRY
jgi:hypothetical protein